MLSPGNASQEEVTAMDLGMNGSPARYRREHGFAKAGSLSGETGGRAGSGSPPYGIRDGFRMELFGGKVPGHDPELCFPTPENLSMHGKGQLGAAGSARVGHHGKQRRYAPAAVEDRSISLGFCAGNGIFYDDVFDPHSALPPTNGYYPKRYFDETGCYPTGLGYGSLHGNGGYYTDDASYTGGGFYGNGGCFDSRTFPDARYAGESGPVPVQQGTGSGPREGSGGGHANSGQGLCGGAFPEVKHTDQIRSRSKDGATSGDENRELNAFPVARYCSPYVDMEGVKGPGRYDADQGDAFRQQDTDCFGNDDGLQRNPSSVSRFQEEEPKTEPILTDASFFRALTTTSGYAEDFPSNPGTPLRPISSSPGLSSHEPFYRSTASGNKYPYLPDPTAKPFSQLLANRATYPTCRNASTVDGFYIPTTF